MTHTASFTLHRTINSTIFYRQKGCNSHQWHSLRPGQSDAYAWDEPMRPRRLTVRVASETAFLFTSQILEEEDESVSCPPKKQRQSRHHPLRQKLWWTKEERLKILESCREMGEEFKTSKPDLVQDYLDLYEEACCLSPVATSPSSSPPTDDVVTFPAHARGLEWCIAPSTRSHRRQHVEDIVEKQHQLRRTPIGRDKREQILSRRSIQSSRPSRLLAQWTGQMDYRKHQQEEEQT